MLAQARAEGADPWVVASGGVTGATAFDAQPVSEADVLGARLVELGVSRERLLLEERALSTSDNLALSMPLLQATDPGVHRVAVVTSDGHVARVRLLLHRAVVDGRTTSGDHTSDRRSAYLATEPFAQDGVWTRWQVLDVRIAPSAWAPPAWPASWFAPCPPPPRVPARRRASRKGHAPSSAGLC